jgi:hypothetical protein
MSGRVTVTRRKRSGYRRTLTGTAQVCLHRVAYTYDITGVRLTEEHYARLEEEAEERARHDINAECWSGELNCVLDGEREVTGWWEIDTE